MYSDWKSQPNSFTWLAGIPGCGKTVLSSAIIEDLALTSDQILLYFFFDSNDVKKQSLDKMLRSLLYQFYYAPHAAQEPLNSLYDSCGGGTKQPSIDSLQATFFEMLQKTNEVWIILDALDECKTRLDSRQTCGILPWIRQLSTLELQGSHMLITSREEEDIKSSLLQWMPRQSITIIEGQAVMDDIRAYVQHKIREDANLSRWQSRKDIQKEIEEKIVKKSGEMLVFLYFYRLFLLIFTPLRYYAVNQY